MSTSIAPPPKNENGKYALIALLFLGGAGGLAAYKFRGGETTVVPTATTPSVVIPPPPPRPREDDTPPPPDPIPTATATGVKVAGTGSVGGGPPAAGAGGCSASCGVTPSSELQGAVALRGRQARRCYERELANDPKLSARMTINVKVGAGGQACSVSVVSTDNQTIASCVAQQFRSGGFPATKGGCAEINVPLNFVAR
jgi:hypothetical protein